MKKLYITLVMIVTFFISSNVYAQHYEISFAGNKKIGNLTVPSSTSFVWINSNTMWSGTTNFRLEIIDTTEVADPLKGRSQVPFYAELCIPETLPIEILSQETNYLDLYYNTGATCKMGSYNGKIHKLFFRLAKPTSYWTDGWDDNLGAEVFTWYYNFTGSTFYINNARSYQNLMRFITMNAYLSYDVYLSNLEQEKQTALLKGLSLSTDNVANAVKDMENEQIKTNEKLDDLKDSITSDDTSGADSQANDFFTSFESNDFGLTGIITAPLNLISNIASSNCVPLTLPLPFVNKDLTLPCLMPIYETYFGSFLTLYQIITFGLISYYVIVNILAMVKGFKDPDNDEIQVVEL